MLGSATLFANPTVVIAHVSETEIRVRRARMVPEDEAPFSEEAIAPLSNRDRDRFLALLANPKRLSPFLKRAIARHKRLG